MDQKLWVFEIFWRSLGGVGMTRANEEELTTCAKNIGKKKRGNFGKGAFKALGRGCPSTTPHSLSNYGLAPFFQKN
jgi:hypothetical protein